MLVLVTGASGAVGAALIPRLAQQGHQVRALARTGSRVATTGAPDVVRGDVVSGAGLAAALRDVEVAYYLVHSMETVTTAETDFATRDRVAAERFAAAAHAAGVRRIVYLGGLLPDTAPLSSHLASRLEVETLLLAAAPEAVALRASIVIGARSRSFRLLVRLVERLPVLALPAWRGNRTQPIDARDVLSYLTAAATSDVIAGPLSIDIVGPDRLSYAAMLERIRDALALGRPRVDLPLALEGVASRVVAAIAREDLALVAPLMGSLGHDLLARDESAATLFGVRLHSFDAAVEHALRQWEADEPLAAR